MAEIDEVRLCLPELLENLRTQMEAALSFIGERKDRSERERMLSDIEAFFNTAANETELLSIKWTGRLNYRARELEKQSSLIQARPTTSTTMSTWDTDTGSTMSSTRHVENKMRLPQLEVPVFSGSYRDYPTFWTIYDSLIHSNQQLTNTDNFLFVRQALEGPAATLLGNMPVIGQNYEKAIKLLNKRFNKSGCIADLLITELEKLPRAQNNSVSCRQTLTALTEKLTHIECFGVSLDNNRMWRRLILSKFPDTMSERVLSKEQEKGRPFSTDEILDMLENATAMKEIIALTTDAFNDSLTLNHAKHDHTREGHSRHARFEQPLRNADQRTKNQSQCVCGSSAHNIMQCPTFRTPEARRNEARRRGSCWKCFNSNHKSSDCNVLGPCPKCNRDHTLHYAPLSAPQATSQCHPHTPVNLGHLQAAFRQQCQHLQAASRQLYQETEKQHVLMTASALMFNVDKMDYEPVAIFFDTGAQKSSIKAERSEDLNLPVIQNTTITVSGFGGLTETFSSNEVSLTLKNKTSGTLLKGIAMHTKSLLTSSMSTAKLSFADRRFIWKRKIRIAQPTLKTSVITPDILVGQDLIDTFLLRKEACITSPSGLVLTPTVFGYAISGSSSISMSRPSQTLTQNGAIIIATAIITKAAERHEQHLANIPDSKSSGFEMIKAKNERSSPDFTDNDERAIQMKNGKLLTGSPPLTNNSSAVLSQTTPKQPKSLNTDACSDVSDKSEKQ
ncbi:hypothetical protein Aduo_008729 [Ancylostoma duodenale]